MKSIGRILLCSTLLLLAPVAASAQAELTLFVGGNFGGNTDLHLDTLVSDTSQLDYGFRLGLFTGGLISLEFDYGRTPNFYGTGTVFDSSSVTTMTGGMALRFPAGPVRPYFVAGIGLIKRSIDYVQGAPQSSATDSRAAYSLGAGVNVFFSQHVGINGDFRYFRNFTAGNIVMDLSNDPFDYSRASLGVVFKF